MANLHFMWRSCNEINFIIYLFVFPFLVSANTLSLVTGLYHLEWAYGTNSDYKTVAGIVGNANKIGGDFYLKNEIDDQSNDEVYIVISKDSNVVFFKHEEFEGGPASNLMIERY